MSRIEIEAGGRRIVVEHGGELEPMKQAALELWAAAEQVPDRPGPAVGFQADRRWTPEVLPTSPGRYGAPPMAPVTAGP
ncbi:hypothetical protein ACWER9_06615 [Micromonospora sp. NPDC003944]